MFPGGTELLIIILVIVLLFGASRIPKVMKGLGEGMRSFKDGLEGKDEKAAAQQAQDTKAVEASPLESQLMDGLGRMVEFKDGVVTIGVPDGKKIISVEDGLMKLEGQGSIETVQVSAIKKIVEVTA